jgi:hypothetical protein
MLIILKLYLSYSANFSIVRSECQLDILFRRGTVLRTKIASLARAEYDAQTLSYIEQLLNQKGTLTIPMLDGYALPSTG